jgi:hypothetical protein
MNTENIHKYLQHKIKQNHKNNSIRLKYQKYMKLLRLMKTLAAAQKLGGKVRRQTSASCKIVKSMRQTIYDRTKADVKISAPGENLCAYQKLRRISSELVKKLGAYQKIRWISRAPIKKLGG